MKLFIDTANVSEIREAASWGVISGVTTNPSLIAKEGRDFKQTVDEICTIINGPISAEAVCPDCKGMVEEARSLAKWHKNVVVKIPMTEEGIKAVSIVSKEGICTNVTLVFSASQALLAAKAGATYVSPFVGRLDDIKQDGMQLVRDIAQIYENYGLKTEIITASVRNTTHVVEAAKAGSHIATVPYKVLKEMFKHPLTDAGIDKFMKDWATVPKK